jgi:hypothetical protein
LFKVAKDEETSIKDFRIKFIELSIITIAAFSLVLLSTEQKEVKYLLASFAGLIVYQIAVLGFGANKVLHHKILKGGSSDEEVSITHYSYSLRVWDYITLIWYALTLLTSVVIIVI